MKKLVIIAESVEAVAQEPDHMDKSLRMIDRRYLGRVIEVAMSASLEVACYNNPASFLRNAERHQDDVVLSLWHGEASRNNICLMPSICEALSIPIIGADTVARAMCDDKWMSRLIARDRGLSVAEGHLVSSSDDIASLENLRGPVVIKPRFGGMSMGVSVWKDGDNRGPLPQAVLDTLAIFPTGVIIEQFVRGGEVMITAIGEDAADPKIIIAAEVANRQDPKYFENKIFDARLKTVMSTADFGLVDITARIPKTVLAAISRVFQSVGSCHHLRIDGRWDGANFTFLEFAPTPNLRRMGAFTHAAECSGMHPGQLLSELVRLAVGRAKQHS